MALFASELALLCEEISKSLVNQRLERIVVQSDRIYLGFGRKWLLLGAESGAGRFHLTGKPPADGQPATPFCMLLRKHLGQTRLVSCQAASGGCELTFHPSPLSLRLVLKGSRAALLFGEEQRLLGRLGDRQLDWAWPEPRSEAAEGRAAPSGRFAAGPDLSARVEAWFAAQAAAAASEKQRKQLAQRLARHDRLVQNIERDLARADGASELRQQGDLLFAHLHELPQRAEEVTVADPISQMNTTISLDVRLTVLKNAVAFHRHAKRLGRKREAIAARLQTVQAERADLAAALETGALVGAVQERPARAATAKGQKQQPYREFVAQNGQPIWVGRSAKANDALTFGVAHGNDYWLHARDLPGAHVVIPLRGRALDEEVLLDSATLAAYHSSAKAEPVVDVIYTECKHVRKVRGRPGAVTLSAQKNLRLRLDPERLARLLGRRLA